MLADFWTYTCINWLRTLAYVRAWAEKYRDRGLVVVGVHTPEFPFEREIENVREAAKAMLVEYPITLDSDNGVWRAFGNRCWRRLGLQPVADCNNAASWQNIDEATRIEVNDAGHQQTRALGGGGENEV